MSKKRLARIERLFYILTYLTNHEYATASTLANHCKISIRSIYRDMRILEELGVQIITDGKHGYRLISKPYQGKHLLNQNEWMALTLLPLITSRIISKGHPFYHAYLSSLEKIKSLTNRNQILEWGNQLSERIILDNQKFENPSYDIMSSIIEAMLNNLTVEVIYLSMYRNEETKRKLDPYYILPRDGSQYIIAYCHLRDEFRIFRLSRIKAIRVTNEAFAISEKFDINQFLENRWSLMDEGKSTTFVVKFTKNVARYVEESHFYTDVDICREPNGDIIFQTTVKSETEFLRWVRSFGLDAEVIEPIHIREKLRDEFELMRNNYST